MTMKKLVAIAFFLALAGFSGQASAATAGDRQACESDAYRLCQDAIPDEQAVKSCLLRRFRSLSPGCKRAFSRGRRR
jgi:hypothetical protein